MRAARSTYDELRSTLAAVTDPETGPPQAPLVHRSAPGEADEWPPIEGWMQEAFEGLVRADRTGEPFTLLPCTVNGEPTAAIVHLSHRDDQGRFHVTPLFVGMTQGMVLVDPKGRRAGSPS